MVGCVWVCVYLGGIVIENQVKSMGQLDVYSLEDISIITIMAGPVSTYFSEEIEASIESVVAYVYSANTFYESKKRVKLFRVLHPAGDVVGPMYMS